jgi:hypothetical protein
MTGWEEKTLPVCIPAFDHRQMSLVSGLMKGIAPTMGWIIVGLLLFVSFVVDLANVNQGGAIDFRNRITGMRLMADHLDAYHYKWDRSDPPEYCDPYNNPKLKVSKTTSTPALLLTQWPLALLPYRAAEFLWLFLQWLLLLGTAWLWFRRCCHSRQRWMLAALVTGFTYTAAWRLHVERGQSYVLLLFLFAGWLTATLEPKTGNRFSAGLLAGLLITLRPPFLLLVPFLLRHRRGQLPGAAVGLFLGLGLPLLVNPDSWSNYFSAMQTHSELYRTGIDLPPGLQHYPPTIEGMPTDLLANYAVIPYADFSVHAFLRWIGLGPVPALPLLLAVGALFVAWLWLARNEQIEILLLGVAAWFFLIDLFLPAYRNSYNDVLILNVAALALLTVTALPRVKWICMLPALPLGLVIYVVAPTQNWLIDLPSLLFTLFAILCLVPPLRSLKIEKQPR